MDKAIDKAELVTLSELAYETGYTKRQVIKWVEDAVLLPKAGEENKGGREGRTSYYPKENLARLRAFRWYEDTFEKQPGKVGGKEALFHILFAFGFSSPEIYEAEKKIIAESAAQNRKDMDTMSEADGVMLMAEAMSIVMQSPVIESLIMQITKDVNPKADKELIKVFSEALTRKVLSEHVPSMFDFEAYIESAPRLNPKAMRRMQEGLYFVIATAAGLPNEEIVKKHDLEAEAMHYVGLISEGLVSMQNDKKAKLAFYLNPKNAAILPMVFLSLRERDDEIENLTLTKEDFTDKELEKIPGIQYGSGVKQGKTHIKLDA